MGKATILVADDEEIITRVLESEFVRAGYNVAIANDGEDAWGKIQDRVFDAAILDVRMPKKNGIELLKEIMRRNSKTAVIIMTAFGTIRDAVEAVKIGAYDYVTKPFDNDALLSKVSQALRVQEVKAEHYVAATESYGLVGDSEEVRRLKAKIQKIRNFDSTVLVTGESGTGKGVVERILHSASHRSKEPFVHVNCAVLPGNLFESELFGHEKGAFTGAVDVKKGKLEAAGKGTVFLDEISCLTPGLQAKLLTVLQERKMERVGGLKTISMEARIIAATNVHLEEAVGRGEFREDLYYRLNVFTIECPPLRSRKGDVVTVAEHFIRIFNSKFSRNITHVSPEAWQVLQSYKWPGNIRELENTLESAVALSEGECIDIDDLPLRVSTAPMSKQTNTKGSLETQEIEMIKKILAKHKGHREKAAEELGISRRTLQYKLNRFGLRDF